MKQNIFTLFSIGTLLVPNIAHANACDSLFSNHRCQAWNNDEGFSVGHLCACSTCPSGTTSMEISGGIRGTYNGIVYTLHAGCAVSCNCVDNPNTAKRGGTCAASTSDVTKPDYSTCTNTPSGATLCNATTNKCTGASLTIGGHIYCQLSGQPTCNVPNSVSAIVTSQYCISGAGDPRGGTACKITKCSANATPNADSSACLCNRGYYMKDFACEQCPPLDNVRGTTAYLGAKNITECYISAKTPIKDSKGTYQYTDQCFY